MFSVNINKIDKSLARLTKKMIKITSMTNRITTDHTEKKRIIKEYYEQLCVNELDNSDKMIKFLRRYCQKWTQEKIDNLNKPTE